MKLVVSVLLAVLPLVATAQELAPPAAIIAPGNVPADFYPKSPCIKPDRAGIDAPPRDATNHRAVAEYNEKVAAYNKVAPAFNACVKDYAARAQNDVTRINAALRDANSQ